MILDTKLIKYTNSCNNTSQQINFINRVSPQVLHEFLRVSTFVFILPVWTSNSSKRQRILGYTLSCNGTAWNSWMKNGNWVIIAKTDFCSLIPQMLVRYMGLKLYLMWITSKSIYIKNFRNIPICLKDLPTTFRR